MNISNTEVLQTITAKTCGCEDRNRKVTYSFIDAYHSLCLDKKDILLAELEACKKLLIFATNELDKAAIEKEILELEMTLDLLP